MRAEIARLLAELAVERAMAAEALALKELAAHQAIEIAKLRHQLYGRSAERSRQIIDQLELVTQPRGFRHLFGESVRLSFWFVGGGQGPLSGAIA